MLASLRSARGQYPSQFWLLFWGMLISTIGSSMIWPFLMIYVSGKLDLPLTWVASLNTISAAMSLLFSFLAGPITDRVGRKWVMVISLFMNGLAYIALSQAHTYPVFALIMGVQGAFNPLYRVGGDAMMADLVPPEKRVDAYSLLRMSNNIGIALGPAIGGFVAAASYTIAFIVAAVGLIFYGLLLALRAHETLPARDASLPVVRERFGGYNRVLRDKRLVTFVLAYLPTSMAAATMWILLSVYSKQQFGMSESLYGFIPMTNALMVVTLQLLVTQWTKTRPILHMVALGAAFYAVGVASVALGGGFWGFWISMVVMTIGELIAVPTSSTYVANLAPTEMRGRYMSLYGLTWSIGSGVGGLFGGFLSDTISPTATWYGAGMIGMVSVIAYMLMARRENSLAKPSAVQN